MTNTVSPFDVRVGFLGNPNSAEPFKFWKVVPWSDANFQRLKDLGFNTIQVNVAWGPRPDDEPLNIEDVVELPPDLDAQYPQIVPLNCDPSPERRAQRRADVRARSEACHRLGLRTIFHFGAPFAEVFGAGDAATSRKQPEALFAGQLTRPLRLRPSGPAGTLGVRFHPWGARWLSRMPLSETTDRDRKSVV